MAKLRAPAAHGERMSAPALSTWRDLADHNRALFADAAVRVGGMRLADLRRLARAEIAHLVGANRHRLDGAERAMDPEQPTIVTGHQPEFFHPGVWIKNFAIAGFAKLVAGQALNVVADSDLCKSTTIRCPAGAPHAPLLAHVPFDRWETEIPFEERTVLDEVVFARFGAKVGDHLSQCPFTPIIGELWPTVVGFGSRSRNLGVRLALGRQALERRLGVDNGELFMSQFCETESFRRVLADLTLRASEYLEIHNRALAEHRRRYRIRSEHHPTPALEQRAGWTETPFWVWRASRPARRRLFIRAVDNEVGFAADQTAIASLKLDTSDRYASFAEQLGGRLGDWKIRPRAFVTTFLLRWLVGDLFVHGIGGAHYDELNDTILADYLSMPAPRFVVMTATARLPTFRDWAQSVGEVGSLARQRRDLLWNADRHLDDTLVELAPLAELIERKLALQDATPTTQQGRRERFLAFRDIQRRLRPYVDDRIKACERAIHDAAELAKLADAVGSRELAYGLHPWNNLAPIFDPLLQPATWR